ncbi:amidohydrolase [Brevibacillus formosus]|uniref:M20 metallopeptidase family protein n=1 Tax=Brevibacillus TaxID=55080 RepID=UPI000D110147|nr:MULTISPECIES: amidohydrolase [Brevibacillus]MBG9943028.1 peptidase M20 [Brevibacillus formosus]MED1946688.1 amidohydrolase [Brevibacillus formosus]MED1996946.1 amidohydrolase [Brevibacillus formosus]MED2084863.1 amidohydrolase [Brevibacillus formosus]PSK21284.1 amidohydrolase [Brevibacillus sp. NRRL NRS-603]
MALQEQLKELLKEMEPQIISWRRHLHQHPELSFQEEKTPALIAEILRGLHFDEVRTGVGGRGVIGVLRGGRPGKVVALRADFDALPIQDQKEVPYKSTVPGVMHACGHDAHTSQLLGLASVLAAHREQFAGEIRFIFQHAEEENPGGATQMVQDGAVDGVDAIFGVHLWSMFPVGKVYISAGPLMANTDDFSIEIKGRGGHGAVPEETVDSIVIGSQIVGHLQTIASRNVSPLESVVVTVGTFHGGDSTNIIADSCRLTGTVRTFLPDVRDRAEQRLTEIAEGTAAMMGGSATVVYDRGYPAVINHEKETMIAQEAAIAAFGAGRVESMKPLMGGEDFSYYLEKVPGAYLFVGAGNPEKLATYPHHHPRFDIDEDAMLIAGELLGRTALHYLETHQR